MTGAAHVSSVWADYWRSHPGEVGASAPAYLTQALLAALRVEAGQKILEAGIGTGGLARAVAGAGAQVVAIDIVPQCAVGAASAGLRAVVADLFHLPFQDACFDAAYNSGVMEHFDDKRLAQGILELTRVVRPCGRVVCVVPSASGRFYRWGKRRLEAAGRWEYGVEIPQQSLREPMSAAGLVEGQEWLVGVRWQARFLDGWRRRLAQALTWPVSETSRLGARLFGAYLLVSAWRKPAHGA